MADSEMEWTEQTYRLDEIERKFDLPCVICLNEGYYSETDADGFSRGDIMSIDSKMVLHKVAANFASEEITREWREPDYVELEHEILVPLNYKGKLKVYRHIKNYENVRELANDFPRYAKVRENLTVTTEENVPVTIQAGTIIELDRIFPGSERGTRKIPDKLVIQFEHSSGTLVVAVPFDARGKFRTEPDNNEYTIREAIDRYNLPQHVRFVDDKIKRVYTQDLLEGIENMRTITETLRLNRLVTQNVLVGHYKPLDEAETNDTERFRQRTLVVLPINDPEIRDIEVNVLKGVTDDVYEQVFLVRNVSKTDTEEIVDGCLYVDFAMTPGVKIISPEENESCDEKPPPRPPKPGHLAKSVASKPVAALKPSKKKRDEEADSDDNYIIPEPVTVSVQPANKIEMHEKVDVVAKKKVPPKVQKKPPKLNRSASVGSAETGDYDAPITTSPTSKPVVALKPSKKKRDEESDSDDNYIIPEPVTAKKKVPAKVQKKPPKLNRSASVGPAETGDYEEPDAPITTSPTTDDYVGFNLAGVDFSSLGSGKSSVGKKSRKGLASNLKSSLQRGLKASLEYVSTKEANEKREARKKTRADVDSRLPLQPSEGDDYEPGVYEEVDELQMMDYPFPKSKQSPKGSDRKDTRKTHEKPTARVLPSSMSHTERKKLFKDLNRNELVDRLNSCGLQEFASFCKKQKLNGSFFNNVSRETLQKDMNLKGIDLAKFIQMRDENWVPS